MLLKRVRFFSFLGSGSTTDRSESVQEIVSRSPGFTERWALVIFFILFLLLVIMTFFIRSPDIIESNALLKATNAPREIINKQGGKLVRLFVKNDDEVEANQVIAWIESTADHNEVARLATLVNDAIDLLAKNESGEVIASFGKSFHDLGELQPAYQQFSNALQQFNDYLVNGYYFKRRHFLCENIEFLRKMNKTIGEEKILIVQGIDLARETFNANDSLFRDHVISRQEFRDQKSALMIKQLSLPQMEESLLSNENQQLEKFKELEELEHTISQQKTIFWQSLQTLRSAIAEWTAKYVITAAVHGRVVLVLPLQEHQFLPANEILGYVNPDHSNYYAQVNLPQFNFGKVIIGQRVQLRFDAYPYQEFGYVEGVLQNISRLPSDSGFPATVFLPDGLVTNSGQKLQYRIGLQSRALIVTKDSRLLQRMYNSIISGMNVK